MKMMIFQDYALFALAVYHGVEIDSVDVEDAVCRQKSHGELWSGNGHHCWESEVSQWKEDEEKISNPQV